MTERWEKLPYVSGEDARTLLEIVWRGIIDANNGNGTHEDIQAAMERAGYECPESLEEYGS